MKSRKDMWLELGVRKLRSFGFVNATMENVLSDEVYRFYFIRFMQQQRKEDTEIDEFINKLIEGWHKKNEDSD